MFYGLICADEYDTERLIGVLSFVGVIALSLILLFVVFKNNKNNTTVLAYGAICIALSFGLSLINIPISLLGGSITLASMVPIILFAYCFGIGRGLMAGLIYGILQFIQSPYFYNFVQFLFDYLLAFSVLGLAGIFFKIKNVRVSMILGALVACLARYVCATVAGLVWFYAYGPIDSLAVFGSTAGMSAFVYSLAYNAVYMLPETIITVGVIAALSASKQLLHVLPIEDPLRKKYVAEATEEGSFESEAPIQIDESVQKESVDNSDDSEQVK